MKYDRPRVVLGHGCERPPTGRAPRARVLAQPFPVLFGSRCSRSPFPSMLMLQTTMITATPAVLEIQGATKRRSRPSVRMFPQLGVGGGKPRPRKLKAVSVRII